MDQKLLETLAGTSILVLAAIGFILLLIVVFYWMKSLASERIAQAAERTAVAKALAEDRAATADREIQAAKARREETNQLILALTDQVKASQETAKTGQDLTVRLISVLDGTAAAQNTSASVIKEHTEILKLSVSETERGIRETREGIDDVGNRVDLIIPAVDGGTEKVLTQLSTVLVELGKMRTALDENVQQTTTSNKQLREVFAEGLNNISEAIVKIVVIDAAKPADGPKRDTATMVQVIGQEPPTAPKTTTTNGLHKVEPTSEKPDEPKL